MFIKTVNGQFINLAHASLIQVLHKQNRIMVRLGSSAPTNYDCDDATCKFVLAALNDKAGVLKAKPVAKPVTELKLTSKK